MKDESQIVMEHTGCYDEVLTCQLSEVCLFISAMNRQFGFYLKYKTAMKNNLIGILDQT